MLLVHHNALAAAASNDVQVPTRFHQQVPEHILPTISPPYQTRENPPIPSDGPQYDSYGMDYNPQVYQQPRFFNPYMTTLKTEQADERPPSTNEQEAYQYTNLSPSMDLKRTEDERSKGQEFQYPVVKQEVNSDILDMDAQRTVYQPTYGYFNSDPLPPMSSVYQGLNWAHPPPMQFHIQENYQPQEMFTEIEEAREYCLEAMNRNQSAIIPIEEFVTITKPPKETQWKTNETRKQKTYNCSSCCKWFTSSGHLKRHFSTALHQNGVRLSGQPDPALLPTSSHHHPNQQVTIQPTDNQQAGSSFNQQQNFYEPIPVKLHQSQVSPQQVYYNSSFESIAPKRCDSSSVTSFEDEENEIPNTVPEPISYPQQIVFQENQMIPTNQHKCIECDKVFNKSCYLTQHNKSFHNGLRPFKCQRCGKKFACIEELDVHFAKHNGEKPHKCQICPKQFHHKTDLRRHMCTHNGKPFFCDICGKGFIRNDHMIKHTDIHRRKNAQMLLKESKNGKVLKRSL